MLLVARGQQFPVGRKTDFLYTANVAFQLEQQSPGFELPQPHDAIAAAGSQLFAIRRNSQRAKGVVAVAARRKADDEGLRTLEGPVRLGAERRTVDLRGPGRGTRSQHRVADRAGDL